MILTFDPLKLLEHLPKKLPLVQVCSASGCATGSLWGYFGTMTLTQVAARTLAVGVGGVSGLLIGFAVSAAIECLQDSQRVDRLKKFISTEFIPLVKKRGDELIAKQSDALLSIFNAGGLNEDKFLQQFLPIYFQYFEIPLDLVLQNPE